MRQSVRMQGRVLLNQQWPLFVHKRIFDQIRSIKGFNLNLCSHELTHMTCNTRHIAFAGHIAFADYGGGAP